MMKNLRIKVTDKVKKLIKLSLYLDYIYYNSDGELKQTNDFSSIKKYQLIDENELEYLLTQQISDKSSVKDNLIAARKNGQHVLMFDTHRQAEISIKDHKTIECRNFLGSFETKIGRAIIDDELKFLAIINAK